ncbi:MAG: hypothetical protein BRC25_01500, partial [Parcubacteria group bacterium SW_6_46_9]
MSLTNTTFLKQTLSLTLVVALIGFFGFAVAEPANLKAQASDQTTFNANLTVDEEISLTVGSQPVTLNENLGLSNDYADGKTNVNVETSSKDGYTLKLSAGSDPALTHNSTNDSFEDYTPSSNNTAEAWSTDSDSYQFGYSMLDNSDIESDFSQSGDCTDGNPT